jgi:hypothetical protein
MGTARRRYSNVLGTHPARDKHVVVPPQSAVPAVLAVYPQPDKESRQQDERPDGAQHGGRLVVVGLRIAAIVGRGGAAEQRPQRGNRLKEMHCAGGVAGGGARGPTKSSARA